MVFSYTGCLNYYPNTIKAIFLLNIQFLSKMHHITSHHIKCTANVFLPGESQSDREERLVWDILASARTEMNSDWIQREEWVSHTQILLFIYTETQQYHRTHHSRWSFVSLLLRRRTRAEIWPFLMFIRQKRLGSGAISGRGVGGVFNTLWLDSEFQDTCFALQTHRDAAGFSRAHTDVINKPSKSCRIINAGASAHISVNPSSSSSSSSCCCCCVCWTNTAQHWSFDVYYKKRM